MWDRCYGLQALLDLTDQIPSSLVVLNGHDYSVLVSSIAAIRNIMQNPKSHGHGSTIELPPIGEFGNLNPIALIRDLLDKCPDEFPSPGVAELLFISDQLFRDSLRNDIGTINRALADSEWKGATVLAGSVVEALLLYTLKQRTQTEIQTAVTALHSTRTMPRTIPTDLEHWNLQEYIEVARSLNLIKENTATQARLGKDFRNLIHPGRSQRLGQNCNRATALSAVAAVEHVLKDLTP
ncbi:MAG: hypothetical protein ACREJN_05765 [Nitrospiraceae bacterium]